MSPADMRLKYRINLHREAEGNCRIEMATGCGRTGDNSEGNTNRKPPANLE